MGNNLFVCDISCNPERIHGKLWTFQMEWSTQREWRGSRGGGADRTANICLVHKRVNIINSYINRRANKYTIFISMGVCVVFHMLITADKMLLFFDIAACDWQKWTHFFITWNHLYLYIFLYCRKYLYNLLLNNDTIICLKSTYQNARSAWRHVDLNCVLCTLFRIQ